MLDKTRFSADTMSTHVLVPNGVAELHRMGALRKILELGPAQPRYLTLRDGDLQIRERFRTFDGIDYGLCIPRDLREVRTELPMELSLRRHRLLDGFRSSKPTATKHAGWSVGLPARTPSCRQALDPDQSRS